MTFYEWLTYPVNRLWSYFTSQPAQTLFKKPNHAETMNHLRSTLNSEKAKLRKVVAENKQLRKDKKSLLDLQVDYRGSQVNEKALKALKVQLDKANADRRKLRSENETLVETKNALKETLIKYREQLGLNPSGSKTERTDEQMDASVLIESASESDSLDENTRHSFTRR